MLSRCSVNPFQSDSSSALVRDFGVFDGLFGMLCSSLRFLLASCFMFVLCRFIRSLDNFHVFDVHSKENVF